MPLSLKEIKESIEAAKWMVKNNYDKAQQAEKQDSIELIIQKYFAVVYEYCIFI